MKITVVGAVGIAAVVILVVLLIGYLLNQQNHEPQKGPTQEPSSPE